MSARQLLFCILAALSLAACKKNKTDNRVYNTVYVVNKMNFAMVGYDTTELGTVIVKRYQPDGTFANLVDSALLVTPASSSTNGSYWYVFNSVPGHDSVLNINYIIARSYNYNHSYIPYDYEIVVPSSNRTYKISGITYGGTDSVLIPDCCPVMVFANPVTFTLDGELFPNQTGFNIDGGTAWLKK